MPEPGQILSHYRLIEKIGEGGMGVVWSAEDTVLGRTVALKLLPEGFAEEGERLTRFEREARFLASLSHGNIAAIHGLEEADGERFLVLEYVPGTSLAQRLKKGSLPVDEALKVAAEIARGLEAAHEEGVIHRDLKPGNVQLTPDGHVKVLDFGLAKAFAPASSDTQQSQLETATLATAKHAVIGTTPYMSPEQATAKPLDRRTDIWSFGCILYELLTGRRAFPGETVSSVMAGIHGRDPDWELLPESTPFKVRDLLRRCLAKDRDHRLHDIADARIEIEEAGSLPEPEPVAAPSRASFLRGMAWTVGAAVLIGAVLLGWWLATRPEPLPPRATRIELTPAGVNLSSGWLGPAISPDGRLVAYCGTPGSVSADKLHLYVRSIDELDARQLVFDKGGCWEPFFSPDGRWVGYQTDDWRIMKVPVDGGEPLPICHAPASTRGLSWGDDGTILFTARAGGLYRVPADGGEPELVVDGNVAYAPWPQHLPGGQAALVSVYSSFRESRRKIAVVSLDTGEVQDLLTGGTYPRYAPSGHLVYSRLGTLYAVPFDPDQLQIRGTPTPVVRDVSYSYGSGVVEFAIADAGALVYGLGAPGLTESELIRIDREGNTAPIEGTRKAYDARMSFSPDGGRLAVTKRHDMERYDVWIYEIQRGDWTRLTFDEGAKYPVWSPEGEWIVYAAEKEGFYNLFRIRSDGTGEPERLTSGRNHEYPRSLSPDGTVLALTLGSGTSGTMDIMMLPLDGERIPRPFLATPRHEHSPAFSPDGRWVAYVAGEEDVWQIWVQPYPGPGPRVKASPGGAMHPVWGSDGRELFFSMGRSIWRVPVETENGFRAGEPEQFAEVWLADEYGGWPFEISPDGQWLVTAQYADAEQEPLRIVYAPNWTKELERMVAEAQ